MKNLFILVLTLNIGLIYAQYTLIPDTNFEQALIDQGIDSEGNLNGQVLTADIAIITDLNVHFRNIADLTGIEDFMVLEYLDVHANNLSELDVTSSLNLRTLLAYNNSLVSVDLPNSVEIVYIYDNDLTTVDFSNHPSIKNIDVTGNPLQVVNLENATSLEVLKLAGLEANIGDNLNVTNCIQLKEIFAAAKLTSIDLSTNIALEDFQGGLLHGGETDLLTEIDCSNNPNLSVFAYINGGQLERLNLNNGNNETLTNVYIDLNEVACFQVDDAVAANNGTGVYANWQVPSLQEFSEDCFTIGIEEVEINDIAVFPNPSNSLVSLNIPDYELQRMSLFNQIGEKVASFTTATFDISNLSNGIYYVKVEDRNQKTYVTKILKE